MEWRDTGILLSIRHHGETSAIVEVFTPGHGRHAGVVRGATSRKLGPVLQPGAQLDLHWRARLEEHLGAYSVELQRSRAVQAMGSRLALSGLNAVCALLAFCLPEREPHAALYLRSEQLLDLLGQDELWPLADLPQIADVRVCGAVAAVEFMQDFDVETARRWFIERGTFIRPLGRVVYLTPAYVIAAEDLSALTTAITDFAERQACG